MKKIILLLTILLVSNLTIAQNSEIDERRYIAVTGSAEVTVAPDEIELEIILREHTKSTDLSSIESKFIDILKKHNIDIDEKQLMLGNSTYYWYYWWRHYRKNTYTQKTYKIKLDSSTDFLSLVKDLDFEGVQSLRISNSTNKNLQQLRREVKISALKAAKEKAMYLLESIDEKAGKVISIEEMPETQNHYRYRNQNIMSNASVSISPGNEDIENVKTIKLRYEVKAKFEIK